MQKLSYSQFVFSAIFYFTIYMNVDLKTVGFCQELVKDQQKNEKDGKLDNRKERLYQSLLNCGVSLTNIQ